MISYDFQKSVNTLQIYKQQLSQDSMLARIKQTLKNMRFAYRQNRLLGFWEQKKYGKMASMFKKKEDYTSYKIDQYPFIYFLINQKDNAAIDALLEKLPYKADILSDDSNPMGISPICFAYLQGDNQIVQTLKKHEGSLNKPNSSGQNLLHLAAVYKRDQAFKKAMSENIDVNMPDQFGNTPFHYAARAGSVEMVAAMVAAKARKLQNRINQYPIHMAIQSGSLQTFQLLKSDVMGAYPKYHPIHSASRSGNPTMLLTILKMKPSVLNIRDSKDLTPLHHAVILQDIEMVRALLNQQGILVNQKDQFGNMPLHLALMNQNLQISQLLVGQNANLDTLNQDNLSPADYGITSKNKSIHSFLLTWRDKSKKVQQWSTLKY